MSAPTSAGYSLVPPITRQVRSWRRIAAWSVGAACVGAALLLAVASPSAATQGDESSTQRLWGLGDIGSGATSACQGASGFLHMSLCTTTTMTTTTSSTSSSSSTSSTSQTTTSSTSTGTTTSSTVTVSSTTSSTSSSRTWTSTTATTTSVTTTTATTTSSTVTTSTMTTTPWLQTLKWVGCFAHQGKQELSSRNTLPKPLGYTTSACAGLCRGAGYTLLGAGGKCSCAVAPPAAPEFAEVEASRCGLVCTTEEQLKPKRYCGGNGTYAAFQFETPKEVLAGLGNRTNWSDTWPSWPRQVRGPAIVNGKKVTKNIIKGISYGPVPLKDIGVIPDDDFMSLDTQTLWARRGDLGIMKALGANTVRLYGDDPRRDHTAFLDEALKQGLEVIVGLSDYPYTQSPDNCLSTGSNCYAQVKEQYIQLLKKGLLSVGSVYHPALRTVILMNEPDLKFPEGPKSYTKALVSAFDAALDAEKEVGVAGEAPTFTATFSFGVCGDCSSYGDKPALGQMVDLRHAMRHPESVGYTARNDVWAAYKARFINSVNTANPATDIRWLFLNEYDKVFEDVPVFIGEYHSPRTVDQKRDLRQVLDIAEDPATMLIGISFFEYQVRYDKGGAEMTFGMFGLDDKSIGKFHIMNDEFEAYCLTPVEQRKIAGKMYDNQCGSVEYGVDYVTDSQWSMPMDQIPTPEFCCDQCGKNMQCMSWTWVEDANLTKPGSPAQCWLKGGLPTGKVPKDGVISGIPGAITPNQDTLPVQIQWGQCGGHFWEGPTTCSSDWKCTKRTDFYHQCMPKDEASSTALAGHLPNIYVHEALAAAYGGPGVTVEQLCPQETTTATKTATTAPATTSTAAPTTTSTATAVALLGAAPMPAPPATLSPLAVALGFSGAPAAMAAPPMVVPVATWGTTATPEPATTTALPSTAVATTSEEAVMTPESLVAPPGPVWFGCFQQSMEASRIYSNEQGGFSSSQCIEGCSDFNFALLHNSGHCSCGNHDPRQSNFVLTTAPMCGVVCPGEELLSPTRYWGGLETFAVYKLQKEAFVEAMVRLE